MNRLVLTALCGTLLLAGPVAAQIAGPQNPAAGFTPIGPKRQTPVREQAPPAVPGARAEPVAVAPAGKIAMDLPPTEALFDAVNRGDLAGAKDAVNRGADLNAPNMLGLTPLELAVDLGRNDISFLLLSLRGGSTSTAARGPAQSPKPPTRAERLATDRAERAERAARVRTAAAKPPVSTAPQTARLFAGGGGAPIPQAGFLGFDANR